jgi:hypothetical protein
LKFSIIKKEKFLGGLLVGVRIFVVRNWNLIVKTSNMFSNTALFMAVGLLLVLPSIACANTYATNGYLTWCGDNWWTRHGTGNPMDNTWSRYTPYLDNNGYMHLTIVKDSGTWYSSEVDGEKSYKYGNFTWVVDSGAFSLDKNCVLGMFTYANDANENDIEFSKWWNDTGDNLCYSVQPSRIKGNYASFNVTNPGNRVVCNIDWKPTYVHFRTWYENNGTMIANYKNTNISTISHVNQSIGMNLWQNVSPSNGQNIDITIYNYSVVPYNGS